MRSQELTIHGLSILKVFKPYIRNIFLFESKTKSFNLIITHKTLNDNADINA